MPLRESRETLRDWLLVAGAAGALMVSIGPVFHFTFAVFVVPLTNEFATEPH